MKTLLCVLAFGCGLAHATMQLSFQVPGISPAVCFSGPSNTGPGSCPLISGAGITITEFHAITNSPGGPISAQELGSVLTITDTTPGTSILRLWLAAQDFSFPTIPPSPGIDYTSNLSITSVTGAGSVGLMSCVDTSDLLAPPTDPFCSGAGSPELSNGPESFLGAGSAHNTVTGIITSLSAPYSLSQEITVAMSQGSAINIVTSQILIPTPEPASIGMLGSVLLFTAGARRIIRRKK